MHVNMMAMHEQKWNAVTGQRMFGCLLESALQEKWTGVRESEGRVEVETKFVHIVSFHLLIGRSIAVTRIISGPL